MPHTNGDELFEDKFERVYAEIRRLDQLLDAHEAAGESLHLERIKRLDERLDGQVTAVQAALAAAEKAVAAALSAADKANEKAESAQRVVNVTQNEFRGSLKDQATTLMPRQEAENTFRELRGLISTQTNTLQELRSRVDVGPPSLATLQTRSDEDSGRRLGREAVHVSLGTLLGAVGAVVAVVYLLLKVTGH